MPQPVIIPVYALHTDTICRADLNGIKQKMPERMKKAGRCRSEQERLLCIGAGLLLLKMLGIPDESVLSNGFFGKPSAQGYPHFNLAHSGDWCLLAIGEYPVGVALERPESCGRNSAPPIFTPAELSWIRGEPSERFPQFLAWKKSVMKAAGFGMALKPDAFEVLPFLRNQSTVLGQTCWYADTGKLDEYIFSISAPVPLNAELQIMDMI